VGVNTKLVSFILIYLAFLAKEAEARFTSYFSLAAGEEYSDNIFFSEVKDHDFVTIITPTLSLAYQPSGQTGPAFSLDLSPSAELFARHNELNSFGDSLGANMNYAYRYSPRLTFDVRDRVERCGESRTSGSGGFGSGFGGGGGGFGGGFGGLRAGGLGGFGAGGGLGSSSGGCGGSGGRGFGSFGGLGSGGVDSSLSQTGLVAEGELLRNEFETRGNFLYRSNVTFSGGYRWEYTAFLDEGGKESQHYIEVEGAYRRWQQHNLRARYEIGLIKSRDGEADVVHDFEVGDDFFSSRQIQLTPTLTLRAATGIALRTGNGEFQIENKLNIALVQIWRNGVLAAGVTRDLTGSEGVSGPSFTTTFFAYASNQFTRRLIGVVGADFSMFDTEDTDFDTLQVLAGVQYWLTRWLSANLAYNYRRLDPNGGTTTTDFLRRSVVDGNTVFFSVTANFDLWPNLGFSRRTPSLLPVSTGTSGGAAPLPSGSITP